MAIEARLAETRQCPHCNTAGAVSCGMARGLQRYQRKAYKKTFNTATGTTLQGLHKKNRWLTFGDCLTDGWTVRKSAERCNFAVSTSFRWRHRFLPALVRAARHIEVIIQNPISPPQQEVLAYASRTEPKRKAQRVLARQKRGSVRYAKQRRRVVAIQARQGRIRKDWHHRVTRDPGKRFGTVVL